MWYLTFWTWLSLVNILFSSSIHFPANEIILFFFIAEQYFIVYNLPHFLYPSMVVGYWVYSLAILNSAVINMGVQLSLFYFDLTLLQIYAQEWYSRFWGWFYYTFFFFILLWWVEVYYAIYKCSCDI
jgi:hypothetical protein